MEKIALKTRFILPPNVNGRCRGRLSLSLHTIQWQNEYPFQFNWIQAKIIWWGDKYHSGATLKLKNKKQLKKSFGHGIHYNIQTKLTLFRNYLRSSERIEVKFSSGISNIDIGKADIPIPPELIEFIDQQAINSTQKVKKFRKRCHILNVQNQIMGELLVEYELALYDIEMDNEILTDKYMKKPIDEIENDMNHFNLDTELAPISPTYKKSHKKKSKSSHKKINIEKLIEKVPTSNTIRLSSEKTCTSPLFNYLTGRPLAEIEENEAIKAMQSTSPTESLIDLLSNDLNGLYLPKKINHAEMKVFKEIDCLRIQVYDLCLTKAGTREVLSQNALNVPNSFSSGTFMIDIDLDSILSTKSSFQKNNVYTSKVTRIYSSSIEALPPSVTFNQSSVHKLNKFCIKSRGSYANGIISLRVSYRDIESSESQTLGTARIQLADVIQASNLAFHQYCWVTTTTSEIKIGRISVKVELGCRGLHFGADFLDAISTNVIDRNVHSVVSNKCYSNFPYSNKEYPLCTRISAEREHLYSHKTYEWCDPKYRMNDLLYESCVYDISDDQTEDKSNTPSTPLNIDSNSNSNNAQITNGRNVENSADDVSNRDVTHALGKVDEIIEDDTGNELKGLFHIGHINYCSWYQSTTDTFLVCRSFWSDTVLVTENCPKKTNEENYQLNYLELFPVICDEKLFDSTKHSFMSIEVWQRGSNQSDVLIGSAKVPLHQFYIAFNNTSIRNHVSQQELPVISIDGWVTITYAASPGNTPVGTVQAILAVGTTKQINNLKKSKSLLSCRNFLRLPLDLYPQQTTHSQHTPSICESNQESVKPPIPQLNDRNPNFAAIFSNFIDTLASRLPERNVTASETALATQTSDATTQTSNSANNSLTKNSSGKYMRPTSELLDQLQRALAIAPTPDQKSTIPHMVIPDQATKMEQNMQSMKPTMFRMHIEIEKALHLPSMTVPNKRSGKRNRNSINSTKKNCGSTEIQPSAYATFEAAALGATANFMSYATNIVENSCSPQWNKHFEVYLPVEFLQNDDKRFVIRVWRKISDNTPKTRLIPNLSNDVTIGFASVDLTVLMAMPINGWFNIIDHSGCINGQIKIHIKPKDDITVHQNRPQSELNLSSAVNQIACEAQKVDRTPLEPTLYESRAVDDSALSRALKRKFTELEEITQRLRARLFDVTGNMSIDPDDEFENDLNTIPDEDDDFEESNIASSMSLDWLEHCHNQASSNDSSNIADQMQDIFEFLSPDANQSTHANQSDPINIDFVNNKLNERFSEVLNDETVGNNIKDDTLQNIAESLQKSAIND